MKVLFINNSGFSKITAELTFLEYIGQYYEHEVWDLSPIYNKPGAFQNIDKAIQIKNFSDFEQNIKNEVKKDNVVIVTNMIQSAYNLIYDTVKKYDIPVIDTQKNNFMNFLERKSAFVFDIKMPLIVRLHRMLNNSKLVRSVNKKIKYRGVKFDYLLSAYNFSPEEVVNFIKTHNVKYDEYLKYKKSDSIVNGKYILFIDSATYFHPNDYSKNDPNFNPEHHLEQLNNYFNQIESKYKIPVVISLHPCSVGRLSTKEFNGRQVTYSKTALLIQHAEFIVSFFSTSLINVVLADKPSIIITSKEIEKSERKNQEVCAFAFAKICGFNRDSLDVPKLPEPLIDIRKYKRFKEDFLVNTEKRDISNGEMLLELLKSLEEKS